MTNKIEKLLSLYQSFIWCDTMKNYFFAHVQETKCELNGILEDRAMTLLLYWYAGLWVVIEGWRHFQSIGFQDELIDAFLKDEGKINLLKDFRNSVLHFQKEFCENRFLKMLASGQQNIRWACELNDEFNRFFSNIKLKKGEKNVS